MHCREDVSSEKCLPQFSCTSCLRCRGSCASPAKHKALAAPSRETVPTIVIEADCPFLYGLFNRVGDQQNPICTICFSESLFVFPSNTKRVQLESNNNATVSDSMTDWRKKISFVFSLTGKIERF